MKAMTPDEIKITRKPGSLHKSNDIVHKSNDTIEWDAPGDTVA
jgi:hypothetical protein